MWENGGFGSTFEDYALVPAAWTVPDDWWGANSVSVIDYDHDGYPDLLVTESTNEYRVRILRNNYGNGGSRSFTAVNVGAGTLWNGSVVADFDLDGREDFLLLPAGADIGASLFLARANPADPGGAPLYEDLGYALGLRDGAAGGGLAADFDGDHALDLFLGRARTDDSNPANQFLYRNVGQATAGGCRLDVRLGGLGDSNGSFIGTRVTVTGPDGRQWRRTVDGGSGRGGQAASPLLVGLGNLTGTVTVTVEFPSGEVDVASHTFTGSGGWIVDQDDGVLEDEIGAVVVSRPSFRYELTPGHMDWVFRWKTSGIKGDLRQDQVTVTPSPRYQEGDPCYDTEPVEPITLHWGDEGVSIAVYRSGSAWQHELRWSGLSCVTDCIWQFRASSAAGEGAVPVEDSQVRPTVPLSYCLPE